MSEHTPGPWLVYRESTCDRGDSFGIKAPHPHYWVVPPLNINPDDVRIMSASLELLSACKSMVSAQHAGPITDEMMLAWKQARAAIAKATGETE